MNVCICKNIKIELYLADANNIDSILNSIMFGKVCWIWCQNSNSLQWNKSPHEIMGKILNCINSANSSSTAEVTLVLKWEKDLKIDKPYAYLHVSNFGLLIG